jgi:mono/diheme cytochrome c family protein
MLHRQHALFGLLVVALAAPAFAALLGCGPSHDAAGGGSKAALVQRGEYMVRTMACADCHTPWIMGPQGPMPDPKRWLQGHPQEIVVAAPPAPPPAGWGAIVSETNTAWAGPWGVSFTQNLTPDKETGLGAWTLDTFKSALRTGRHMGVGRPIQPPMPWPFYKELKDADLEAIFAYLQSIPVIKNKVPEPLPPASAPAGAR